MRGPGVSAVTSNAAIATGSPGTVSAEVVRDVTGREAGVGSMATVESTESTWLASAVGRVGAESSTIRLSTRPPATQAPTRIPDRQLTMFLVMGEGDWSLLITQLHVAGMGIGWAVAQA